MKEPSEARRATRFEGSDRISASSIVDVTTGAPKPPFMSEPETTTPADEKPFNRLKRGTTMDQIVEETNKNEIRLLLILQSKS